MTDPNRLRETILEKTREGKIPCAVSFKIAEDFGLSREELGEILNEMKIKVSQCQLGCFK